VLSATKIACGLLSAKYKYISLAAGSGCLRISTDELIKLSGVQLLIFAVVYAVCPYAAFNFHSQFQRLYNLRAPLKSTTPTGLRSRERVN
jgi:hypothetical protein